MSILHIMKTNYKHDPRYNRLHHGLLWFIDYEDRLNWSQGRIANYEYQVDSVVDNIKWTEVCKSAFSRGIELIKMPFKI